MQTVQPNQIWEINMTSAYSKGSEWRKWDLQIHIPGAKHADQYSTENGADVWMIFTVYDTKNEEMNIPVNFRCATT